MHTISTSTRQEIDQPTLWNGAAGQAWVEAQDIIDTMFRPFEDMLAQAAAREGARHVLDIGCGTGATTFAVAGRLGDTGRCVGIDLSGPMIAAARSRAEREGAQVDFIQADAQRHPFAPASFDMLVSRFGVMFFDDAVHAFSRLRHASRDNAALLCLAWRGAEENPFMTTAERAAAPLLTGLPARDPDKPGQFAFADSRRVQGILAESGWAEVAVTPVDVPCAFPEKWLTKYLSLLGPLGRVLQNVDEKTRADVIDSVRGAFDPYVHGAEVRYDAACWAISARKPTSKD